MKKVLILITILALQLTTIANAKVISNERINNAKVKKAVKIITELDSGPFVAAIYDEKGHQLVKVANSVVNEQCSNNHAEMNAIKAAEEKLNTYDLAPYNLKLYVTAEPCIMCVGGIMWSGIKEVYYSVPSKDVEKITGFDEGFKPHWFKEFKKRGIIVYGNIETKLGKQELKKYMKAGNEVYKPSR